MPAQCCWAPFVRQGSSVRERFVRGGSEFAVFRGDIGAFHGSYLALAARVVTVAEGRVVVIRGG